MKKDLVRSPLGGLVEGLLKSMHDLMQYKVKPGCLGFLLACYRAVRLRSGLWTDYGSHEPFKFQVANVNSKPRCAFESSCECSCWLI
jgi:hypothetical protein